MTDEGAIEAFEKLLGRTAKPAEREQLFRVKEALGLRDNDALWLVLFARQFPKAIGEEARRILVETRSTADSSMKAAVEEAKAELTRAIAIAAQGVARTAARQRMIEWMVAGITLGAALLAAGFIAGRAFGP
jgi:hypothetical protein